MNIVGRMIEVWRNRGDRCPVCGTNMRLHPPRRECPPIDLKLVIRDPTKTYCSVCASRLRLVGVVFPRAVYYVLFVAVVMGAGRLLHMRAGTPWAYVVGAGFALIPIAIEMRTRRYVRVENAGETAAAR